MNNVKTIRPDSTKWLSQDNVRVSYYFADLGFDSLQEILDMRIFDLMNMNQLNAIRVEEIITCLYLFLNANTVEDEAMYFGFMTQHFSYGEWRKKHKDLSAVTVGDLVLTPNINLKAIQHFYDAIRKQFFKSDEYDSHGYRYLNRSEYLKCNSKRKGVTGNDK